MHERPWLVTQTDVENVLAKVEDARLGRPITALGMVRRVEVMQGQIAVAIALPERAAEGELRRRVTAALEELGFGRIVVQCTEMSERERRAVEAVVRGAGRGRGAFASARVIAIASGKGGVGKSSLSTNLAIALAGRGKRTVLIDADVYGFSIPAMMGISQTPIVVENLAIPPEAYGVAVISLGVFVDDRTPVIWRGPMLHDTLERFVNDVYWGEPEMAVIDMPPGTGDVSLATAQLLPDAEVVVVTTPQHAAQRVAQRAAHMAREVKLRVSGAIENMSWFTGNDGERYELFGAGGGARLARELGIPLLGQIPLVPELRAGGDVGRPVVVAEGGSEAATAIQQAADKLLALEPRRLHRAAR